MKTLNYIKISKGYIPRYVVCTSHVMLYKYNMYIYNKINVKNIVSTEKKIN